MLNYVIYHWQKHAKTWEMLNNVIYHWQKHPKTWEMLNNAIYHWQKHAKTLEILNNVIEYHLNHIQVAVNFVSYIQGMSRRKCGNISCGVLLPLLLCWCKYIPHAKPNINEVKDFHNILLKTPLHVNFQTVLLYYHRGKYIPKKAQVTVFLLQNCKWN